MAGIKIKADEEGVQIMNSIADGIDEATEDMNSTCESLLGEIQQYPALGPHKQQIESMVEQIQEELKGSTAPARDVAEMLRQKAQQYQEWIDDDF